MTEKLAAALRRVGCPADTALQLSAGARVKDDLGDWLLVLAGYGVALPSERDDWAFDSLADNVAGANAEAQDRTARGEVGSSPYWPLANRGPRR
jgi:hypothetical protein